MLLVSGVIPKPVRQIASETHFNRAEVIEAATKQVLKVKGYKFIAIGIGHSGAPKAKEQSGSLRRLPTGSSVLVFRTIWKVWEGRNIFISCYHETCIVQMSRSRRIFRPTCVKKITP